GPSRQEVGSCAAPNLFDDGVSFVRIVEMVGQQREMSRIDLAGSRDNGGLLQYRRNVADHGIEERLRTIVYPICLCIPAAGNVKFGESLQALRNRPNIS